MISQLIDPIQISLNLLSQSNARIVWNLFLALIPFILSFYLFRPLARRNQVWWAFLLVFIAFLPNAPYILTDSIHIIELSQADYPRWSIMLVLIPQYTLFIVAGFEAYVISLTKLNHYLETLTTTPHLKLNNIIIHGLCIVGIYIGRFERFNSWDFVTKPGTIILTTVKDLLNGWQFLSMAIALLLIWAIFETTRLINDKIRALL